MNEENRSVGLPASNPAGEVYHDRSTGLMVFGILTILLGALAALLAVVTLLSLALGSMVPNSQLNTATVLPGMLMYVGLAVILIWLGIGSIKARRWARALLLIFSWSWLGVGILDVGALVFMLPRVMAHLPTPPGTNHPAIPAAAIEVIILFTILISGFFLVLLPGIWTFFYSSRHVKLTCEWRDTAPGWTDVIPLPVLGLCLWLGLFGLAVVAMCAMPYIAAPFFGVFVSGMTARAVYLVMAGGWLLAGWLLYRLDSRGWWLAVAWWLFFLISAVITYSQHDVIELYRLMHYPDAQLAQIQQTGLLKVSMMAWLTAISMLPSLAYMLWVKRYLR